MELIAQGVANIASSCFGGIPATGAIARSGRPGPVFIDILKNVTAESAEYEFVPRKQQKKSGMLDALYSRNMADLH